LDSDIIMDIKKVLLLSIFIFGLTPLWGQIKLIQIEASPEENMIVLTKIDTPITNFFRQIYVTWDSLHQIDTFTIINDSICISFNGDSIEPICVAQSDLYTWYVQVNGDGATAVEDGDTVQFLNGYNVTITRTGTNITVNSEQQLQHYPDSLYRNLVDLDTIILTDDNTPDTLYLIDSLQRLTALARDGTNYDTLILSRVGDTVYVQTYKYTVTTIPDTLTAFVDSVTLIENGIRIDEALIYNYFLRWGWDTSYTSVSHQQWDWLPTGSPYLTGYINQNPERFLFTSNGIMDIQLDSSVTRDNGVIFIDDKYISLNVYPSVDTFEVDVLQPDVIYLSLTRDTVNKLSLTIADSVWLNQDDSTVWPVYVGQPAWRDNRIRVNTLVESTLMNYKEENHVKVTYPDSGAATVSGTIELALPALVTTIDDQKMYFRVEIESNGNNYTINGSGTWSRTSPVGWTEASASVVASNSMFYPVERNGKLGLQEAEIDSIGFGHSSGDAAMYIYGLSSSEVVLAEFYYYNQAPGSGTQFLVPFAWEIGSGTPASGLNFTFHAPEIYGDFDSRIDTARYENDTLYLYIEDMNVHPDTILDSIKLYIPTGGGLWSDSTAATPGYIFNTDSSEVHVVGGDVELHLTSGNYAGISTQNDSYMELDDNGDIYMEANLNGVYGASIQLLYDNGSGISNILYNAPAHDLADTVLMGGGDRLCVIATTAYAEARNYTRTAEFIRWQDDGDIDITGQSVNVTELSDRRVKSQIKNIEHATEMIKHLEPKQFFKQGDDRRQYGFIAQDYIYVFPSYVTQREDGMYQISTKPLEAVIVQALKNIISRVEKLEQK
jgi:hypothetical protein